jgi:outer membrane protein TolC
MRMSPFGNEHPTAEAQKRRPFILGVSLVSACASTLPSTEIEVGLAPRASLEAAETSRGAPMHEDAELEHAARLDAIIEIALAKNPDLREAKLRVRGALERASSSGRLPDLEFKSELWGVPLARPYALGEAATIMFGLRQMFPAPGSLSANARAALEEAKVGADALRSRERDVIAQVRKAFAELSRADTEFRIHVEHAQLTQQMLELARTNYEAGRSTQQDVLRLLVELSRLHTEVLTVEEERTTSQTLLNTLMARAPDAPLGPPVEVALPEKETNLAELESKLDPNLPELQAAHHGITRSTARVDAAQKLARIPSVMIGADYWFQPTMQITHAYGAMLTINLPWLNPRHGEEVREAEDALLADESALESTKNSTRYRLREAWARAHSARGVLAVIERDLLVQAKESLEAANSSFSSGRSDALGLIDALKSYLDVRLDRARARARLEAALADLDRASGTDLDAVHLGRKP